jgi:glycosyltransferase involved in cell wall biosynthesis
MILSILVPTLNRRAAFYNRLIKCLEPQLTKEVEVVVDNNETLSTGAKRNRLVESAKGKYLVHIDDDDLVASDYIPTVLNALTLQPDAVGYWLQRYTNGVKERRAIHSHRMGVYSETKIDWTGELIYRRTINHICPIRTDLARQVRYIDETFGEDSDYARRLYSRIRSEVFIDRTMYHYYFRTEAQRLKDEGAK